MHGVVRWGTPAFAAAQLMWLLGLATASGIVLLLPAELVPGTSGGRFEALVRAMHSASSLALVAGALLHAGARMCASASTWRAIASGWAAAVLVGAATVSGGALVGRWNGLGPVPLEGTPGMMHAFSVFHYGYSAALAFGVAYGHVRGRTANVFVALRWRAAWPTVAVGALALSVGLALPEGATLATRIQVPTVPLLGWWPILAPTGIALAAISNQGRPRKAANGPGRI